jgi:hypothetical protein
MEKELNEMNTDELLKASMEKDFKRTSDLFDLWRFQTIDRKQLNEGCIEIINNAKFKEYLK